jgi:SAM-dependent methyltransferase
MRGRPFEAPVCVVLFVLSLQSLAASLVLFPKAGRLLSPDGRFEVRDAERPGAAGDFVGSFHSLWIVDQSDGSSRKLCDYMGVAAVEWAGNDFLLVTEYVGKKTSRAFVFPTVASHDSLVIDMPSLEKAVQPELRETLRGNDHVFVEASSLEKGTFYFRTWGYGQHDKGGFRWNCQYTFVDEKLSCDSGH